MLARLAELAGVDVADAGEVAGDDGGAPASVVLTNERLRKVVVQGGGMEGVGMGEHVAKLLQRDVLNYQS